MTAAIPAAAAHNHSIGCSVDVNIHSDIISGSCSLDYGADRFGDPALFANDFAHVRRCDMKLYPDVLALLRLRDDNFIGMIDKRLGDQFN
jgi:hypothetical protein